jgi:RNA polymerase sigma-70 factor (ECF subfamily)
MRYASRVQATLVAALGADPAVEDLCQEVFLGLFRRAAQLREPHALKAYLLGSAVRIAAFKRRSRARRRHWFGLLAFEPTHSAASGPVVEERDAVRALRRILDTLPLRPRMAFVLRYVEELSSKEIALALDISEATAKRAVVRGRERVLLLARRELALRDYLVSLEGRQP